VGIALEYARVLTEIERTPRLDFGQSQQTPEILSVISHELRTPVAAIKGFITTLLSNHRYWDAHECEAFLENVNESADQLSQLVENVLEMGRLDKGLGLHRRPTRLTALVQRVLHDPSFQSSRCELVNEVSTQLPMIAADPLRIERVLRNLVENAVKFSPQGGRIRVFARLVEKEIEVGVEDQGIGIAPEHLPHIFERFYQVDQGQGPKEGIGLGLSIVKELVHAHNGRVWAESTPGSGTTVHFTLPMNGATLAPKHDVVNGNDAALDFERSSWSYPPDGYPTILIVEDDQQMLKALQAALEREGFEILSTSFGNEAIDLIQTEKPDLVLLDLVLPDVDGLAICEQVRRFSSVPIIIITGRAAEQPKVRGLALGADDYLVKPFSHKELLARIRAVLRRARVSDSAEPATRLRFDGLEIDPTSYEVITPKGVVKLTPTEHKLLCYLAANAGRILTHQQLLTRVWGYECDNQNEYLWVNISRLRKKIEPDPEDPRYIVTEPGLGYSFRDPDGSH
jgi:two-component system sensor histidine kinase ChiS